MDPETQRGWDRWARALIREELRHFAKQLGTEIGRDDQRAEAAIAKLRTEHTLEIATLRSALDEVRSELAVSHSRVMQARRRRTSSRTYHVAQSH